MINFEEIELNALNAVNKNCLPYEEAALYNTRKVIKAFRKHKVSDYYLNGLENKVFLFKFKIIE